MKNINLYNDTAAYTADTNRPANESTVSHILDGTGTKFEGKNILVDKSGAEIGDILVFDKTTSLKKFIKASTLNVATLPASIVTIGVVYHRQGDNVFIVAKHNAPAAVWAQGFKSKLTGFDFATGGSFTITVNAVTTAAINYSAGQTLANVVTAINAAINAGSDNTELKHWTVAAGASWITIEHDRYTPVISAVTVTDADAKVIIEQLTAFDYQTVLSGLLTSYANISRNDGTATYYAGANFEKFYQYYYASGGTTLNQAVGADDDPVRYAVYNSVDNAALVAYYGPGEVGYAKYLQDKMTKHPYFKNAILDDNGQLNTNILAGVTFIDGDGSTRPAYPAADNCKIFTGGVVAGYVTGLEAGSWWLPSVREFNLMIKDRRLDLLDRVNLSLSAIGSTTISPVANYWTSSERSSNDAWFYYGTIGLMNSNSKYNSVSVRPVTAL